MLGAILLSLLAHIGFAGNDLSGAIGARKMDSARMALYAWICGSVLFAILTPFLFHNALILKPFIVNAVLGIELAVSYPLFLQTLVKGNPTINGVIAGTFPIWVVIFSLIFFGESLTGAQAISAVVIFVGIILSSLHLKRRTKLKSLMNRYSLLALIVSLMWGINFAFVRYPIEQYGWFEANIVTQVFATVSSIIFLSPIIRRHKKEKFKKEDLKWPISNALFGVTSGMAYNFALTLTSSSIVAPIAGSYPGLYAIASYFIFKEKLTRQQIVGVVMVLIGVISLSFFSL